MFYSTYLKYIIYYFLNTKSTILYTYYRAFNLFKLLKNYLLPIITLPSKLHI